MDETDHERFVRLLYAANSTIPVHLSNYQGIALLKIPRGNLLAAVGAWCLMPNHFHLLLREVRENGISEFVHKLLTGYSMYFNTRYHRKGSLFEGTFSAKHLDRDPYLKYQYAYINLNPIGIIDKGWKEKKITNLKKAEEFVSSYMYSSHQDHAGIMRDEKIIISPKEFPSYFESGLDFRKMVEEWMRFEG